MKRPFRATFLFAGFATLFTSAGFAFPLSFRCTTTDFQYINRFTATGVVEIADADHVVGTAAASYVRQGNKDPGSLASTVTGFTRVHPAGELGPRESRYLDLQIGDDKDNRLMLSLDAVTTYPSRLKLGIIQYRANCETIAPNDGK